ncbi:hypothetical protein GLAREA_12821 [Glarea lozoyensis ATCC 20868]|uniref:Uncharacterized protein n=1 Tax=Glarea lozoyensis (strain ATCC 20868 / MF5171) TaxID=1116229 RepID=S3DUJ3_GLAL2|nr:uncharacterized protein GLAREA_12821 [Glarea lozoyensis ATCC 20868]EPE30098.1 hypothetical protein GLAREA_12821 [Glarea lozoyensis ATCC 20868]
MTIPKAPKAGRELASQSPGYRIPDDRLAARIHRRAAYSGHYSPHDENPGVRRDGADRGADLEGDQPDEEDGFDGEERVELPECGLEGHEREEVGGGVPAYVGDGAEVRGYGGDGGGWMGVSEEGNWVCMGNEPMIVVSRAMMKTPSMREMVRRVSRVPWTYWCMTVGESLGKAF